MCVCVCVCLGICLTTKKFGGQDFLTSYPLGQPKNIPHFYP